jgi:hypothetical protein
MRSIVADGFDGAFFQGREAGGLLGGVLRLVMDVTVAPGVVAPEVLGSRLATEVAVDAGGINIELPGDIFRQFLGEVGHGWNPGWRR